MFSRIAFFALTCALAQATVINESNGDIPLDSDAGRKLVQNARRVQNGYYYGGNAGNYNDVNWADVDTSYIAGYSVKFQGCHHVQEWNADADGEEDIKIKTQRLVRFRMCPKDSCSSSSTKGCDANYGDYLVDLETYVEAYMYQMQQKYNNGNRALENNNKYNVQDYLQCQEIELNERQRQRARELRELNNGYGSYYYSNGYDAKYYVGPYCAEQGGEIRLGVFLEDTCTVAAEGGADIFKMVHNGMALPYSEQSIVNLGCFSCGAYSDLCTSLYSVAGKCETKMNVYYPNESACSYINGIKVIREDGVIRTSATRKSTAAAITTGVFLTAALLLSGYVYYLRTKLGRARINLAASSENAGL